MHRYATMLSTILSACLSLCLCAAPVFAAQSTDPAPETHRDPFPPQAIGTVHTIRIIPEACAYVRGNFTGDKTTPYRYGPARSSDRCQPRAKLVDPLKAKPSVKTGWILNDVIRIPSAACPSQQAVVRVWRKPADNKPPPADAQGRPRIYLEDAKARAAEGKLAPIAQYTATLAMEGSACP